LIKMNFQFFVEKLKNLKNFEKFTKEKKDAFLCGCFFVIDKEEGKDKQHFDFFIPSENKILSFPVENGSDETEIEVKGDKVPTKISFEHDFDFRDIEEMIKNKMEGENIDKKIQKMLYSLQNLNGEDFLIGTIFISGLGMISVKISLKDKKIVDFNNKSFFDFMKIVKKDD